MRAFFIECYFYQFKYFDDDVWCFLHLTGDETLKKSLPPAFFENYRIRDPLSFKIKKLKLKGDKNGFFS